MTITTTINSVSVKARLRATSPTVTGQAERLGQDSMRRDASATCDDPCDRRGWLVGPTMRVPDAHGHYKRRSWSWGVKWGSSIDVGIHWSKGAY